MPNAPPRLHLVFQKYDPPLYFVTFNTHRRKRLLANARVHRQFVQFARKGKPRGIAVGRFVIMPDHIHVFVRNSCDVLLSQWVRLLKRHLSEGIVGAPLHWQKGFFSTTWSVIPKVIPKNGSTCRKTRCGRASSVIARIGRGKVNL